MENVGRDVGFEEAGMCCCVNGPQRNRRLVVGLAGVRIDECYGVDAGEDPRKIWRVAGGGRRRLKLTACIDKKAASGGVSANARVAVESVLVGAAVVVDDRLAEVIAVVERSAADAAEGSVDGLNACRAFEVAARSRCIRVKLAIERFVDFLCLVQCRVGGVLRVINARAGLLEHMVETGAGPWAHIEKDIVNIAEAVEPEDCLIDPAVDRDVRGIEH